ncbi:hypothetical protein [Caldivirga sp.]
MQSLSPNIVGVRVGFCFSVNWPEEVAVKKMVNSFKILHHE